MKRLTIFPARIFVLVLMGLALLVTGCGVEDELAPTPLLPPPTQSGPATTAVSTTTPPEAATTETAATAVADGTATPTMLPTPTLLPTATPVTDPPIAAARAGQLPATSRDLVFIAQGALRLWNHNSSQLETLYAGLADSTQRDTPFARLPGDITQYDVSADGNRITAVRLTGSATVTATLRDGDETIDSTQTVSELLFLDTVSRDSWTLAPTVANLQAAALAPNQQHVAFIGTNLSGDPAPSVTRSGPPLSVFLVRTPDGTPQRIADCAEFCYGLTWHPQSDLLLWTDREALWLYNLSGSTPQVLRANQSDSLETTRLYEAIDWAGNGRFLLLWEQGYEGGTRAVLDVPTGQLIPVPDTFVYADPFPTEVMWMQDDRLLVLRSTISGQVRQAAVELWRVVPDAGEVVREEQYRPEASVAIAGGLHLENGRFAYGLLNQTDTALSGLYIQTSLSEQPERVNGLVPAFIAPEITWAPDGSGAIVQQNGFVFYAPAGGSTLLEMSPVFGAQAHSFTWLDPGTVPR